MFDIRSVLFWPIISSLPPPLSCPLLSLHTTIHTYSLLGKWAHWCNSGMTITRVTNHFQTILRAALKEGIFAWYCEPDQTSTSSEGNILLLFLLSPTDF